MSLTRPSTDSALNNTQQEIIRFTLETMLDIPNDEENFHHYEKQLFEAFREEKNPHTELEELRNILYRPNRYFLNLEKHNPDITIGDVQKYVLDYFTEQLQASNYHLHHWKISTLKDHLPYVEGLETFHTVREEEPEAEREHNPSPWEIIPDPTKIFSYEIEVIERRFTSIDSEGNTIHPREHFVIAHLSVQLENSAINSSLILGKFEYYKADLRFVREMKILAGRKALSAAAELVFSRFEPNKVTLLNTYTESFKNLVTDKLVIKFLENGVINFAQVKALRSQERIKFLKPRMLELVDSGFLTWDDLKKIDKHFSKLYLFPLYANFFEQGKISQAQMKLLNASRINFLLLPAVTNLITLEKITLQTALTLPVESKDLLTDPSYFKFFLDRATKNHWQQLAKAKSDQFKFLGSVWGKKIFANQLVSAETLFAISPLTIKLLNMHPFIIAMAECNRLSLSEVFACKTKALPELFLKMYFNRLQAIFAHDPIVIQSYNAQEKNSLERWHQHADDASRWARQFLAAGRNIISLTTPDAATIRLNASNTQNKRESEIKILNTLRKEITFLLIEFLINDIKEKIEAKPSKIDLDNYILLLQSVADMEVENGVNLINTLIHIAEDILRDNPPILKISTANTTRNIVTSTPLTAFKRVNPYANTNQPEPKKSKIDTSTPRISNELRLFCKKLIALNQITSALQPEPEQELKEKYRGYRRCF